ncbi:MAG: sensor histidine kinase [Lachnospiraceae bacterium]|nr:sensor histidine kinase [Lachnospiraceae bacterium]
MTEIVLDLMEQLVRAGLLLFLCKDIIQLKEKYRSVGRVLFFMQAFLLSYWMSNSVWVNRVLYMNEAGEMNNSSYSIVKLICIFACSFLAINILYQGRWQAKLYVLLVFYTVQEMARFTLHSIWHFSIMGYLEHLDERLIHETIAPERYMEITRQMQAVSLYAFAVGYLLLMYITLKMFRRYQTGTVTEINRQGLRFLMLAPIIGMAFDVSWRVSFYTRKGTEIDFLYEKHGSMYVVVPTIAVLCLICIVFSRKIYGELVRSEEHKSSMLFYKQQLADMTAHVKELEQLYDGIRGMRHDLNNYVADMEQLLQASVQRGQIPERIGQEAEQYLYSMHRSTDRLALQFSTGNPVTDVILNRKGQICEQEDIALDGDLLFPSDLGIEAFDLGILLNNALDNAIEACRCVPKERHRSVRIRGYVKGRMFFLVVENTCDDRVLRPENGELQTTKVNVQDHGFGMSNMRSCVEKYYGTMQYEVRDGLFILTIMLQGNNI